MNRTKEKYKITPNECLELTFEHSLELLIQKIGHDTFELAKQSKIESPLFGKTNTEWTKCTKIIGINPRITKTYWGIVKYALTFPEESIHIMPIFETTNGGIYSQNSWNISNEFIDTDLKKLGFETAEKQLLFVINILHALGKIVGFDATQHVDNFSEIVFLNPSLFEWIKLNKNKTKQDFSVESSEIAKEIEKIIIKNYNLPNNFFKLNENEKKELLFPKHIDKSHRRSELRSLIRNNCYEPMPVTEHAPMRPIRFEKIEYTNNENWATFTVENKADYAKIIGSITPYKLYETKDEYPIKNKFDENVLKYITNKFYKFQKEYNFDFLRADMGHNQTAHSHKEKKQFYTKEFWAILKRKIQKEKPYFATFAEAFWNDYYIPAIADMKNKNFDLVLGELNYEYLNKEYINKIKNYIKYKVENKNINPILAIYTNDGDLPENDKLYESQEANECRFFTSIFMNLPSYMGIGYETRNLTSRNHNEYTNYLTNTTAENFRLGSNKKTFVEITKMRDYYQKYKSIIDTTNMQTFFDSNSNLFCWYYKTTQQILLFVENLDFEKNSISIPINTNWIKANLIYTNSAYDELAPNIYNQNNTKHIEIADIYLGECAIYELTI